MRFILRINILFTLLIVSSFGIAQDLTDNQRTAIKKFVQFIEEENWAQLAEITNYPLNRAYPVPDIESEAEFIVRHTEVFDETLIQMISNSITDSTSLWKETKDKALTLNYEITLDSLGNLMAIKYESVATRKLKEELIEVDRKSLPVAMQEYVRPVLQMETEKFRIRIDETQGPSYRMVVWILGKRNPNVPAVNVVPYGVLATYETRGAQTYTFKSDFGTFVCLLSKNKEDGSLPADLLLYRDNELVRAYPAISFQN